MLQANSMFSRPRATSPIASLWTLPCSAVIFAASSLAFCFTRFRRLNIASVRLATLEERHSWNAAFATATAASSSSTEARATAPVC
jgi:hypothetical protein